MHLPQFLRAPIYAIGLSIWANSRLLMILGATALLGVLIVGIVNLRPISAGHSFVEEFASARGEHGRSLPTVMPDVGGLGSGEGVLTMAGGVERRL